MTILFEEKYLHSIKSFLLQLEESGIQIKLSNAELLVKYPENRIDEQLLSEIKLRKADIIAYLSSLKNNGGLSIPAVGKQANYVLSSSQKRLWALSQLEDSNKAYNIPGSYVLHGNLNISILELSFKSLIERHEILRTVFKEDETGEAKQFIIPVEEIDFSLTVHDLRNSINREKTAISMMQSEIAIPFNLISGPLFRVRLFQLSDNKFILFYVMHHIIIDSWSMNVMKKEIFDLYAAYYRNKKNPLPPLRIQYKDYATWQQNQLAADNIRPNKEYWLKQFEGELPVLQLNAGKLRPAVRTNNGGTVSGVWDNELTTYIKQLCQAHGATLYMGMLAMVNAVLYKYTKQQDIIIGTSITGREHAELENQIGFYLNVLPLRTRFNAKDSFIELLQQIKTNSLEAYEHQAYPFDELVGELSLKRDISRHALFDVMVEVFNMKGAVKRSVHDDSNAINISRFNEYESVISRFDLTFYFDDLGTHIRQSVEYNSDIYDREFIENLISHFEELLRSIIAQPGKPLEELNYVNVDETNRLLHEFNDTGSNYRFDKTLHQLFEEQVKRTPSHPALKYSDKVLTYQEINERANQLGHYLRSNHQIQADDLVGIKLERTEWTIIAILGTLKAGGAYLPIDPQYPAERINFMIADSGCKVVIDEEKVWHFNSLRSRYSKENGEATSKSNNLAYVIYTSGSTGTPKGVMIEHRNVINYIEYASRTYNQGKGHGNFGLFTSLSFDLTVTAIFTPLLYGNWVKLYDSTAGIEDTIRQSVSEDKVDILKLTPSHINVLGSLGLTKCDVGQVIVGGEELMWSHVEILKKLNGAIEIYNEYGPTECTVGSIVWKVEDKQGKIVIGSPISNTQIYILDNNNKLSGIGVAGEICIGGAGVGRGYLNNPQLTAERFINNPFKIGEKIYRTGDVGRWLQNKTIEFMGRRDEQVKIRGYRIELGEVEQALQSYKVIEAGCVSIKTDIAGSARLVAFIVGKERVKVVDLRTYLKGILPEYMVPQHFIQLDTLPLTINGKIDKNALPGFEGANFETGLEYIAPRTDWEIKVVSIWEKLLSKKRIGIRDSFFELGGDSIKVLQVMSEIRKTLNLDIPTNLIYKYNTIESLLCHISDNKNVLDQNFIKKKEKELLIKEEIRRLKERILGSGQISDIENVEDIYPMSAIEKGMVYESILKKGVYHDQMVHQIELTGFEIDSFRIAVELLTKKHPILRTGFNLSDFECEVQIVYKNIDAPFYYENISNATKQEQEDLIQAFLKSEINKPFNISTAPLWRLNMFNIGADTFVIIFQTHHSIIDGWSDASFNTELSNLYLNVKQDPHYHPEPLKASYKDYVIEQELIKKDETIGEFWKNELSSYNRLDLFTKESEHTVYTRGGDSSQLNKLRKAADDLNTTVKGLALSAYLYLLKVISSENEILTGIVTNTRPDCDDSDKILGCFLNTIPLKVSFNEEETITSFVKNVNDKLIELNTKDKLSMFDISLICNEKLRNGNPFFDVYFNFVDFHIYDEIKAEKPLKASKNNLPKIKLAANVIDNAYFNTSIDITRNSFDAGFILTKKLRTGLTAKRVGDLYFDILSSIISNPQQPICQSLNLGKEESQQVLIDFNKSALDYPKNVSLVHLFEDQVSKTPDAVAFVFEDEEITYAGLKAKADHLASYLITTYNINTNDIVAIKLERSPWLVIAIWGVLKAGGAYVPMDPGYPKDRITYILEDCNCKTVIDQQEINKFISIGNSYGHSTLDVLPKPDTLAYVMYTSGSTGKPKGVMVQHKNVVNFFKGMSSFFGPEKGTMLSLTNCTFDISILELLWTLTVGFKLVLQKDVKNIDNNKKGKVKQLDFSLYYFGNADDQKTNYQLLIDGAKYADINGFSTVWIPERHFNEFGGLFPNPSVLSAALSTITKNIKIHAGSVVAPLHNPLRIAEEWAVVDNLSAGRIGIACATGWHADDFVLSPENFTNRREKTYQAIDTLKRLWAGGTINVKNGKGDLIDVKVFPKPVQKELPLWITSSGNIETFILAGKLGANILTHLLGETVDELAIKIAAYRKAYKEHGHEEGKGKVTLMLHTYIGVDSNEIYRKTRKPFGNYLRSSLGLIKDTAVKMGLDINSEVISDERMEDLLDYSYNRYVSSASLIGTKQECMDRLKKLDEIGVDEIACLIDFGVDYDSTMKSLQYITELKDTYNAVSESYSISEQVEKHQITHVQMTPSMATLISSGLEDYNSLGSLKKILLGGEQLPLSLVNDLYGKLPQVEIYNMYGPTETTIWSTCCKVPSNSERIHIGKPIANTQIYILNESMQVLPIGIPGEIYIAGQGVAKGYINKPELSAQRFIPNPYLPGENMYRTGDFGRWLSDGTIELIGRKDDQVKIHGVRIELGEIESALRAYEKIESVAVIVKTDANDQKALVAYLVSKEQLNETNLRSHLSKLLPEYMVPTHFVQLEAMPLSSSGKIDKKSLAETTVIEMATGVEFVAPRNETEQRLIHIWENILNKKGLGVKDDFFKSGGHSLLSIRLLSQIQKEFRIKLSLKDLFAYTVLENQALLINDTDKVVNRSIISLNQSSDKEKVNVYFIPPVVGSPSLYLPLTEKIKDQCNCYGFQYKGLEEGESYFTSIKDAALDFSAQILRQQTSDEFIIFSYSMGGLVAFEMVKILEKHFTSIQLMIVDKRVQIHPAITTVSPTEPAVPDFIFKTFASSAAAHKENEEALKSYLLNNLEIERRHCLSGQINSAIHAFESRDNSKYTNMNEWKQFTKGEFSVSYIEGDHWNALADKNLNLFAKSIKTLLAAPLI